MHQSKLDTGEASKNTANESANPTYEGVPAYLSSSASLINGWPVCIVCMRKTWLLLCLS